MKRIICALTTMFVTSTAFNFALAQKLPDAIDKIRPAIIQVRVNCPNGSAFAGTGFFVSTEGLALTAAHVVNPCPNPQATNSAQRIQVGIPLEHKMARQNGLRNNFVFVDARILELDQQHDVALIKILANPFDTEIPSGLTMNAEPIRMIHPSVAVLSHEKVREGETVAVSGYPLNYPALMTNAGIIASTQTSRYFDPPQQSGVNIRMAMDYYDVDMSVNHGNSGGPVYNAEGEVVGICDAFKPAPLEDRARATQLSRYGYNAGIAIVVPIAYAEGLVSKHQSPSKAIDSKGTSGTERNIPQFSSPPQHSALKSRVTAQCSIFGTKLRLISRGYSEVVIFGAESGQLQHCTSFIASLVRPPRPKSVDVASSGIAL